MICQYQKKLSKEFCHCDLGLYGGKPSLGACQNCTTQGHNNQAFADSLVARAKVSHPVDRPRLSGCCDRADQA